MKFQLKRSAIKGNDWSRGQEAHLLCLAGVIGRETRGAAVRQSRKQQPEQDVNSTRSKAAPKVWQGGATVKSEKRDEAQRNKQVLIEI